MAFSSPEAVEHAFYAAIEAADLEAMIAVWEPSETIICIHPLVCIHPLGPALQGLSQIQASWRQIFDSGTQLRFQIEAIQCVKQQALAVNSLYEHITVLSTDEQPSQSPIIATNVYHQTAVGWQMVLHHASPGPANRGYQSRFSSQMH